MQLGPRFHLSCVLLIAASVLAPAQNTPPAATSSSGQSVADAARANREKNRATVRVRPDDAKELFASVDRLLEFVSHDTGYARRSPVKRELLNREQFQRLVAAHGSEDEQRQRQQLVERSEIVMKKFGLLPPAFTLNRDASAEAAKSLAAFYRFSDRTMYLLDWIPLESQKHIMAHELTHALQDQAFDLTKLMKPSTSATQARATKMSLSQTDDSERRSALLAIVEGQATLVEGEYMLNVSGAPDDMHDKLMEYARNQLERHDGPVYVHAAPRVLQEAAAFPYREGAAFEMEVLHKAGRRAAFSGVFARPPISTHEILQPDAYLAQKRVPDFTIPDLRPVLGEAFEPYDTGSIGEFDVQVMAEEFGRENDFYSVVPFWNGGGYVAVKKAGLKGETTSADIGLLYASDWKSAKAATRFAQMYKGALPKRVKVLSEQVLEPTACAGTKNCPDPLWAARVVTSDGLVFIEVWPGNHVFISHSFDDRTVSQLRALVLNPPKSAQMVPMKRELSMRLSDSPTFAAMQEEVGNEVRERMLEAVFATRH